MNAIGIVSCTGFFVVVFCQIYVSQWLVARRSGWSLLHGRYPPPPAFLNRCARSVEDVSLCLNGVRYHNWPSVGWFDSGLAVFVRSRIFRFHGPIVVPWDDISLSKADDADGSITIQLGNSNRLILANKAADVTRGVLARRRFCGASHHRKSNQ